MITHVKSYCPNFGACPAEDRCPPKDCHDCNLKSGDELISMKETFGLCEGRAEQHYYI